MKNTKLIGILEKKYGISAWESLEQAYLYHGTSTYHLKQIFKDGVLKPIEEGNPDPDLGGIFFTTSLDIAEHYAKRRVEFDEELGIESKPVFLRVDITEYPEFWKKHLFFDPNEWVEEHWEHTQFYVNTSIPLEWIEILGLTSKEIERLSYIKK